MGDLHSRERAAAHRPAAHPDAPELHHWHHDRDRDAGNYANISPIMGLLFGTYRCPDHEPEAFGVRERMPRRYVGQLLHPFMARDKAPSIDER